MPPAEEMVGGPAAIARDAEEAKELFNCAMRHFKAALDYFQLDGFVTRHCSILLDVSNLYRSPQTLIEYPAVGVIHTEIY